jgi:hypothetical protein
MVIWYNLIHITNQGGYITISHMGGYMDQVIPNNHAWEYQITMIGIDITCHGSYNLYSTGLYYDNLAWFT